MNDIYIFYTKFSKELPKSIFENYFMCLPNSLKEINQKYLRWQDRTSNLLGKILLLSGMKLLGLRYSLNDIKYNAFNKPYFNQTIDFSLTHSGEYVVCVLSFERRVGVDIEEIRAIHFDDFKDVLTREEMHNILGSRNPYSEFFELWTIKESIAKADGRGLSLPLNKIVVSGDMSSYEGKEWHLHKLSIADNYSTVVAYDRKMPSFTEKKFDCEEIISH